MVIGFYGKMGSGKSTAIEALKARGRPVYVLKFAGPLYAIQNFIYSLISPVYVPPEDFVKDRPLLQMVGTSWGRDLIRESLWVDLWKNRAQKALAKNHDLIIASDDTRFDNEAETIRALGGVVIHIIREDSEKHAEGGVGIANHKSEAGIKPELVDYTIHNTGNLSEYQAALGKLFDKVFEDQGLEKL
jgi:hypothetical protein